MITRGSYCSPPEQLLEETLGGFRIAPFLTQDVQRNTKLIYSAPEIVLYALNSNEDLVQVPLVVRSESAAAQAVGEALAEFPAPAPNRLVGGGNASFSQYQLDVTQAQVEDVIQPNSVADDLSWEPMAVAWIGWQLHPTNLVQTRPGRQPGYRDNAQRQALAEPTCQPSVKPCLSGSRGSTTNCWIPVIYASPVITA